jgi:hypothetical protein
MRKDILKNVSFGLTQRNLTTRNIAEVLLVIMQNHIGTVNGIDKDDLFYKVFKKQRVDSDIRDWLRWEFVKKAMHFCRVFTKCFIGCWNTGGTFKFFVLADENDLAHYHDLLENSIRKMKIMQKRARKSIEEQWFKDKWLIENKKAGLIDDGN